MTRRQFLALVLVNTLIALLVALGVIWASTRLGWVATQAEVTPYVIVPPTPTPRPPPTATTPATPTPTVVTEVYVVQAGDTLYGLAERYDIDPQLLMGLNDLTNANRLLVGQRLRVPAGVLPTATPQPDPEPTATAVGSITPETTDSAELTVSMTATVMQTSQRLTDTLAPTSTLALTATPAGPEPAILAVENPGDWLREAVVLANLGDEALSLDNWSLSRQDNGRFSFREFTLAPAATIRIHSRGGIDDRENLYWAQPSSVWSAGDVVLLVDRSGNTIASYEIKE